MPAPIDEVVPALRARPRVVRHFVGRQAGARTNFLRRIVEVARAILVGNDQLAALMQRIERRLRLDRQLIERQMLRRFRNGTL